MTTQWMIFLFLALFCSSLQIQVEMPDKALPGSSDKILIVYLSRTNNTKAIAEIIHEYVGGTLVALELNKPYPEDYKTIVEHVAKENETGFMPFLKTKIDNIQQYIH